jgi:hypothetical protein
MLIRNYLLPAFVAVAAAATSGGRATGGESIEGVSRQACVCTCSQQGRWFVAVTANFFVCSTRSADDAKTAALHCELLRARWGASLHLGADLQPWQPKCQVVLHATLARYLASVGPGMESTVGSSLVRPAVGSIVMRRIDVRAEGADYLDGALPHEIVHMLVAARFRERPAPLWYDEGLALQADPPEKRQLHQRDLHEGVQRGIEFRVGEILTADQYPPAKRMGVFYGQCAALTRLLLEMGTPEQMRQLALRIPVVGLNPAIAATYRIDGLRDLEAGWLNAAVLPRRSAAAPDLLGSFSEQVRLADVQR